MRIIVPEQYQYGYLNMTGGVALDVTVQCSPDHKNTQNAILEYNESISVYQCEDGSASYCCPFGMRHQYRAEDQDPNESDFDYDLVDLYQYMQTDGEDTKHTIANDSSKHIFKTLACDEVNCVIQCTSILSCALSTIYLNGTNHSSALVSCSDSFSCLSTTILVEHNLDLTIICSGEDSCNELTANVSESKSFNMYCVETGSCQEGTINMNVELFGENRTNHGVVHCVLAEVCNDLILNTNSEWTQLIMYEFSRGTVLNNGVGFLSAIENIECNTDRWIQFDGLLETDSTVIQSVHNEYDDDSFPCEDVVVQCDNETVSKSCIMTYEYIGSDIVETLNNGSDLAFSVNMNDLYRITCNGECEESPTQSPTSSPTRAPSNAPSISPSLAPTLSPTISPSISPSLSPTFSPSMVPTVSPTQSPTRSPSMGPTSGPSFSPSMFPTTEPTGAPTGSPTRAPSFSPTAAPSVSPSTAPTQFPTKSDAYDTYIEWQYSIGGLNHDEWQFVVDDIQSFSKNLSSLITAGFDDDTNIEYRYISVNITEFNGAKVVDLYGMDWNSREEKLEFTSDLEVLSYTNCSQPECLYLVGSRFDKSAFSKFVTGHLRTYFNVIAFDVNVKASSSTNGSHAITIFKINCFGVF